MVEKAGNVKNLKKVDEQLARKYNVGLIKHDAFDSIAKFGSISEAQIDQLVFATPIEEVSFQPGIKRSNSII